MVYFKLLFSPFQLASLDRSLAQSQINSVRFKIKTCVVVLFCFSHLLLKAQTPELEENSISIISKERSTAIHHPVAQRFHGGNGLPTTINVFDVQVDRRGYSWFSSAAGVGSYNGYEFQNYTHLDGLADRMTIRSYEDYKGRIWFISLFGQLSYFENNRIHKYKYNSLISPYIDKDRLASIHIDTNDVLHIGTYTSGYIRISSKGVLQRVISDSTHTGIGVILINDTVPLCFANESPIENCKITLFAESTERLLDFSIEDTRTDLFYTKTIRCIALAKDSFLLSYENQAVSFTTSEKVGLYQFSENVIALHQDSYGGIWVGTYGQGVYHYSQGLSQKTEPINYFPGYQISSIKEDLEHGMWVVSLNKGVFYFPNPYLSSLKTNEVFQPFPYPNDRIVSPAKRDNELYLLSKKGILMYSDGSLLHTIDLQKTLGGKSESFSSLYLHQSDQSIWISDSEDYTKLMNNTVVFLENKTNTTLLGTTKASCYSAKDSSFWSSKHSRLLHIKDDKVDRYLEFDAEIRCVMEAKDGTLWIGTTNGLWKYQNDSIKYLGTSDSLLTNPVLSITEFQGSLWMGNQLHGLVRLRANESSIITWKNEYVTSPRAFYVKDGALWFISEGHLNKLSLDSIEPENIQLSTINLPKLLWGNNELLMMEWLGKLTIAGNRVIYQFEFIPEFGSNAQIPMHIGQIKINNRDTVLLNAFNLRHNQNHISIKYLAITNLDAKATKYKYRMEGIDPEWIETSDKQVQYTSLPAGSYVFELHARPLRGAWTTKPITLSITIAPPYWETWWFVSLCILASITLIGGVVFYRFRRLRYENQLQMALNESQQQALSARMNPHFIFNALNSIKTFVLENDTVQSNDYIARFSKLMRQILDQSQYTLIPLEDELKALDNYVSLELMRGKDRFSYSIHVDAHIDQKRVKVPSLLLQPFVENAIWHGVMPLNRPGHISVSLHRKANEILCTIADDGVGRTKTSSDGHIPTATQISNKRLDLINKRFRTRIQIQIEDILDEQGAVLGTKVLIPIPTEFKN